MMSEIPMYKTIFLVKSLKLIYMNLKYWENSISPAHIFGSMNLIYQVYYSKSTHISDLYDWSIYHILQRKVHMECIFQNSVLI